MIRSDRQKPSCPIPFPVVPCENPRSDQPLSASPCGHVRFAVPVGDGNTASAVPPGPGGHFQSRSEHRAARRGNPPAFFPQWRLWPPALHRLSRSATDRRAQPPRPSGSDLLRRSLELAGQRNRFDATAPTRMIKGLERIPEVYGPPEVVANVTPDSISSLRFDRLYFCSRALKQATQETGLRVSHGEIIYPGISMQLFVGDVKPVSAPLNKLLVVGRLNEESGLMTAVQALLQARQGKSQLALSIYGRGETDYISQLRSFVVQNSLPVEFLTVSNQNRDLAAVYRQHDALLYTAEWEEPFAVTPLEAMACGLPVIGANIGGARELLRHGENALTYTPGDAPELAARIQELQMQPALRCQLAETAQAEVQSKYNETTVVDQIENYLNTSIEVWQHT